MQEPPVAALSVICLTGLSGAGKSTIAAGVHRELQRAAVPVELPDGDALRSIAPIGFTPSEREAHVRRTGFMAGRLEYHGVTAVCPLMSPFLQYGASCLPKRRRVTYVALARSLLEAFNARKEAR